MDEAMTRANITVELESAVGPRVLYPDTASAEEVEGELPEGWVVSETHPVRTQDGRWSAPLVLSPVAEITEELERLGAGGPEGIEAEALAGWPARVKLYDTQEYEDVPAARALEILRALPDGAGFGATWEALAELCS